MFFQHSPSSFIQAFPTLIEGYWVPCGVTRTGEVCYFDAGELNSVRSGYDADAEDGGFVRDSDVLW